MAYAAARAAAANATGRTTRRRRCIAGTEWESGWDTAERTTSWERRPGNNGLRTTSCAGGRNAVRCRIMPSRSANATSPTAPTGPVLWGIDLGGTKIEGVIVDAAHPDRAPHRVRLATESDRGYDHIIGRIGTVVATLEQHSGLRRAGVIGVGTPGAVEPSTGSLKNSNTLCLNGRPLGADLSSALGVETRLANDANCFALAEATLGSARGRDVVMGLILGTGVGSGIVVHGRVLHGLHGIAGEWGHNPMRGEATPCYCGRLGCVETVIAGPALERHYRESGGLAAPLPEIARRAGGGDPSA